MGVYERSEHDSDVIARMDPEELLEMVNDQFQINMNEKIDEILDRVIRCLMQVVAINHQVERDTERI